MAETNKETEETTRTQKHFGVNQSLLHPAAMTSPHALNDLRSYSNPRAFTGVDDIRASQATEQGQESQQGEQTMTQENLDQELVGDQYFEASEQTTIDAMLADMANNLQADHNLRSQAWGRQSPSEQSVLKEDAWDRQGSSETQQSFQTPDAEQEQGSSQSQ